MSASQEPDVNLLVRLYTRSHGKRDAMQDHLGANDRTPTEKIIIIIHTHTLLCIFGVILNDNEFVLGSIL